MTNTVPVREPLDAPAQTQEPRLPRKRLDHDELIDVEEVARRLDVAPRTVHQWVFRSRRGDLPVPFPETIGKRGKGTRPVWRWGDVVGWMHERTATPSEARTDVARMRRELRAAAAALEADKARVAKLCSQLHDAGLTWPEVGEVANMTGEAVRRLVNNSQKSG